MTDSGDEGEHESIPFMNEDQVVLSLKCKEKVSKIAYSEIVLRFWLTTRPSAVRVLRNLIK
jgi:hypothetical protein